MSATWEFKVTRKVMHEKVWAEGSSQGFKRVPDGKVLVTFRLEIDRDRLLDRLGPRARKNRNATATLQGGAIKVVACVRGFSVMIDEDAVIRAIGGRAAFSPRGVAKLQGGIVKLRVVTKKRLDLEGKEVQ